MKTLHSLSDINMATVILCGGKSSRLNGEDKALLKYNFNKTFIEKIIEVITYDKDKYVIAILDTDCCGCKQKGVKAFFTKEGWEKAKKEGKYLG